MGEGIAQLTFSALHGKRNIRKEKGRAKIKRGMHPQKAQTQDRKGACILNFTQ